MMCDYLAFFFTDIFHVCELMMNQISNDLQIYLLKYYVFPKLLNEHVQNVLKDILRNMS